MTRACRKPKVNQISTSGTDTEPEDDETSYSHAEHAASIIDYACQMKDYNLPELKQDLKVRVQNPKTGSWDMKGVMQGQRQSTNNKPKLL